MPTFTVEAIDGKGKRVKAEIDAASANDAIARLKSKGYKPMNVKEKVQQAAAAPAKTATAAPPAPAPAPAPASAGGGGGSAGMAAGTAMPSAVPSGGKAAKKGIMFFGSVSHKQLTQFTQQLSVLMDAGLPIVRSLKILANQQKPGLLKNVLAEVAEDVETGSSFSGRSSLSQWPPWSALR